MDRRACSLAAPIVEGFAAACRKAIAAGAEMIIPARMQSSLGLRPSRLRHYATLPPAVLEQARATAGCIAWTEDNFSGAAERGSSGCCLAFCFLVRYVARMR